MNKLADPQTIQQILNCYSALGEKKNIIGNSFEYYDCPFWKNSAMTPVFVTNPNSLHEDVDKIKSMFNRPNLKSKYNATYPYFNLLTKGKKPVDKKLILKLEKQGWTTRQDEASYNFWKKQIDLKIPKGYQVKVGNYFDTAMYSGFLKTMEKNFLVDALFMKTFNKMLKTIDENVLTIHLCKNDKVVGAGLVATKNGGAYLFCGSIHKSHRKKNLWKVLVAARQAASAAKGAKVWITLTSAPELLWRGDETFRNTVFFKKS